MGRVILVASFVFVYTCWSQNDVFEKSLLENNSDLVVLHQNKINNAFIEPTYRTISSEFENKAVREFVEEPEKKPTFQVAVMNYQKLEEVLLFEKLEIGVKLTSEIQDKVNNFVNNVVVPQNQRINPYLEWELRVYTKFTHYPSNEEIIIDGFYIQEFTEYMNSIPPPDGDGISDDEYNNLGGYKLTQSDFSFRTRFAPSKTGLWEAQVFIENNGVLLESELIKFNVIESGNKGFVHTSVNGRYLELGDKTYIPVGCNAPWPRTEQVFDPEFAEATKFYNGNSKKAEYIDESYRSRSKMVPRVYDVYKNVLQQLIDGGANSFRTIMVPFATDIEFGKLGNYTDHLMQAQELDQILELAEKNGVFLQWSLDVQYKYMLNGPGNYYISCSWNSGGIYGDKNCYSTIKGVKSPLDFFSNLEAKKYYKQRLRYIMARWGYSTQISIFELLSEENQVGNNFNDGVDHSDGLQQAYINNVKIYEAWNREMAAFIKSQYNGKKHLLTCSYAGLPAYDDLTYQDPNIDVIGLNAYDDGRISFGSHPIELFSKFLLNQNAELLGVNAPNGGEGRKKTFELPSVQTKPIVLAETGFSSSCPRYKSNCGNSLVEYKRQMWQMPFSGVAGTYNWDMWYFPQMYSEFNKLKLYLDQFDFGDANELWIPGSSLSNQNKNGTISYSFNPAAYENMEDEELYQADMVYMVSKDRTRAAGVISNKTYNWYTASENANCGNYPHTQEIAQNTTENAFWGETYDNKKHVLNKYVKPYSIYPKNTKPEDFKRYKQSFAIDVETRDLLMGSGKKRMALWNMNKEDYLFFFRNYTDSLNTSNQKSIEASGSNNKLKIDLIVNSNEKEFIQTFYAIQSDKLDTIGKPSVGKPSVKVFLIQEEGDNKEVFLQQKSTTENYFLRAGKTISEVSILNSSGNVLQKYSSKQNSIELNFSNLATGVYVMECMYKDGEKVRIKVQKI